MLTRKMTKAVVIRNPFASGVRTTPVAPEPVAPEPVVVEPEPVAPEPVVVEPEPVAPEPVVVEPEAVAPEPVAPEPVAPELSIEDLLSKSAFEVSAEISKGSWDSQIEELISWEKSHKNRKGTLSLLQSRIAPQT